MKKTAVTLLAALLGLLAMAACTAQEAYAPAPSYVTDDQLLLDVWQVLTQSEGTPDTITLPETIPGRKEVQVDAGLLYKFGELLLNRPSQRIDAAPYSELPASIVIEGGVPACRLELAPIPNGGTLMRLSVGADSATFLYDSTLYEEAHALLAQNLADVPPASLAAAPLPGAEQSTAEENPAASIPQDVPASGAAPDAASAGSAAV